MSNESENLDIDKIKSYIDDIKREVLEKASQVSQKDSLSNSENWAEAKQKESKDQLDLDTKRLDIEQRKKYAEKSFRFMARYTMLATIVLIANGLKILKIEATPLVAFMGTISASMVLFGWVLKGLFGEKK